VGFLILGAKNMKELDLTELIFQGFCPRMETVGRFICGLFSANKFFNN